MTQPPVLGHSFIALYASACAGCDRTITRGSVVRYLDNKPAHKRCAKRLLDNSLGVA